MARAGTSTTKAQEVAQVQEDYSDKIKMKVSISTELAEAVKQRANSKGVTQSLIVEIALRDRLGLRPLFDNISGREHA